jgi:hypothetical protein
MKELKEDHKWMRLKIFLEGLDEESFALTEEMKEYFT